MGVELFRRGCGAGEALPVRRAHPRQVGTLNVPRAAWGTDAVQAAQGRTASGTIDGHPVGQACTVSDCPLQYAIAAAIKKCHSAAKEGQLPSRHCTPTCVGRLLESDLAAGLQGHRVGQEADVIHLPEG